LNIAKPNLFSDGPEGRVDHADPMPAPKLGMWLFLASEAMFFIGLLGSFIVLESAGSQHEVFIKSSAELSRILGWIGILFLIASSFLLRLNNTRGNSRWLAIAAAAGFLLLQFAQWHVLLTHRTCAVKMSGTTLAIDGYENLRKPTQLDRAKVMNLPDAFDAHSTTRADFPTLTQGAMTIQDGAFTRILQDVNYGPSRNNFFAMYFLLSAAHVLHLLAGIVAVLWFMLFTKGKLPDAVQIYWHFVNTVGVLSFLVLYFV
jgi:heme/copper-type cytochrome/quinol oxidase subunit 3